MLNYKEVFNTMVDETAQYLINNNLKTMVLGISGGLDSTVTAAICYEVVNKYPEHNFRFIGVSLPCNSNTENENESASWCMKAFCKEGNYWVENLQKEYMLMKATCELHGDSTHISQGNIKARLRMIYLYNLASINQGIVMDTDNLTEYYLGFFTIHGDVADFNPIGNLWKHEVYELANYLYTERYCTPFGSDGNKNWALENALNIRPTDGNGVNDLGDMGQIAPAFAHDKNVDAYTKVDDIIKTYLYAITQFHDERDKMIQDLRNKYDVDNEQVTYHTVDDVISRINRTEYKRKGLPVVIQRENYKS